MDAFALNRVPIDHCFTHGFWFDRDELAAVLQGNTSPEEFEAENWGRRLTVYDPVAGSAITS
jgi:Zn-finger nucleic acid-binding protein